MKRGRVPRLAIVFPSREIGGAEQWVRTIAAAASARGWPVTACFPSVPQTDAFRDELGRLGIRITDLPIGAAHAGFAGASVTAVREAVRTWSALAHARASTSLLMLPGPGQAIGAVLGAALFPARSTVVAQLVPDPFTVTRLRRLLYALARCTGQRWVAVSDDNRDRLARGLGCSAGAVDRIYNGVEDPPAADLRATIESRTRARAQLGLPADCTILVTLARLNPQKGLDVLASAIPRVAARFPNAQWVWAGEGESRTELEERLSAAGIAERVALLGHRTDTAQLLVAADLFILPSRSEGLPFALLEAMAAGVPVIASSLAAIREVVSDGVHARLVAAGDEDALADAMCWALDHPDQMYDMARAAAARVRERFRAAEMVDRTLARLAPPARRGGPGTIRER
jgi:glycosyltransferase involved in cell wall biosynthesis